MLIAEEGDDHPASRGRLEATKLDLKLDSRVLTGPEGRRPVEEVVHEVEVEGNNGRRVQGGIDEGVKFRVIEKDGYRAGRPRLECGRGNALPFERGRRHPADVAHEVGQTVITPFSLFDAEAAISDEREGSLVARIVDGRHDQFGDPRYDFLFRQNARVRHPDPVVRLARGVRPHLPLGMDRFAADTREGYRGETQARELTRCRREVQSQVPARARLGGEERVHLERVRRPDHCPRGRPGRQIGSNAKHAGRSDEKTSATDGPADAVEGFEYAGLPRPKTDRIPVNADRAVVSNKLRGINREIKKRV